MIDYSSFKESKAYQYAVDVLDGKFPTNKYIKAICKKFLYEIDHQEELLYYFDYDVADKIINIMKLINFATGAVAGQSLYEACVGYQYFLYLISSVGNGKISLKSEDMKFVYYG